MHDAAYSVDAVDLAHNPMFPLAVSPVMVPKTDKQAQEQGCAAYWNAAKARCLDRHAKLSAHDDVSHPPSGVQVLDTKWV